MFAHSLTALTVLCLLCCTHCATLATLTVLPSLHSLSCIHCVALAVQRRFDGKRILLGVDRLDYVKGIPHKLLAMEHFLDHHPEWCWALCGLGSLTVCRQGSESGAGANSGPFARIYHWLSQTGRSGDGIECNHQPVHCVRPSVSAVCATIIQWLIILGDRCTS